MDRPARAPLHTPTAGAVPRRAILQCAARAAGVAGAMAATGSLQPPAAMAQGTRPTHLFTWTAPQPVMEGFGREISAFSREAGRRVQHRHVPWPSYQDVVKGQLIGGASEVDVCLLSDSWLPEFAEKGWVGPIDAEPDLARLIPDIRPHCRSGITFRGRQYGLPYYTDVIAFIYNRDLLRRAGIEEPPTSWDEVVAQSLRIQRLGLARVPLALPLDDDPWLIEIITALAYAFGGRFVREDGSAAMADAEAGVLSMLDFLRDAMRGHRILSAFAHETAEPDVTEAMAEGEHVFALLPGYRLRTLNDPRQSRTAGDLRVALMPRGGARGAHATVGWVRFFAATRSALSDPQRRDGALRLMAALGGPNVAGEYAFQRRLLIDAGLPSCALPLDQDPAVTAEIHRWTSSPMVLHQQAALARPKDLICPWLSAWQRDGMAALRRALAGDEDAGTAMRDAASRWNRMRDAHG